MNTRLLIDPGDSAAIETYARYLARRNMNDELIKIAPKLVNMGYKVDFGVPIPDWLEDSVKTTILFMAEALQVEHPWVYNAMELIRYALLGSWSRERLNRELKELDLVPLPHPLLPSALVSALSQVYPWEIAKVQRIRWVVCSAYQTIRWSYHHGASDMNESQRKFTKEIVIPALQRRVWMILEEEG